MTIVFRHICAQRSAVAALMDVLPTPPLPVWTIIRIACTSFHKHCYRLCRIWQHAARVLIYVSGEGQLYKRFVGDWRFAVARYDGVSIPNDSIGPLDLCGDAF